MKPYTTQSVDDLILKKNQVEENLFNLEKQIYLLEEVCELRVVNIIKIIVKA
jgi:hypothetical protein